MLVESQRYENLNKVHYHGSETKGLRGFKVGKDGLFWVTPERKYALKYVEGGAGSLYYFRFKSKAEIFNARSEKDLNWLFGRLVEQKEVRKEQREKFANIVRNVDWFNLGESGGGGSLRGVCFEVIKEGGYDGVFDFEYKGSNLTKRMWDDKGVKGLEPAIGVFEPKKALIFLKEEEVPEKVNEYIGSRLLGRMLRGNRSLRGISASIRDYEKEEVLWGFLSKADIVFSSEEKPLRVFNEYKEDGLTVHNSTPRGFYQWVEERMRGFSRLDRQSRYYKYLCNLLKVLESYVKDWDKWED